VCLRLLLLVSHLFASERLPCGSTAPVGDGADSTTAPGKLADHPPLRGDVEDKLMLCWSPQQISRRLVIDHPDDPSMRVWNVGSVAAAANCSTKR
jgi:hypothetical protein